MSSENLDLHPAVQVVNGVILPTFFLAEKVKECMDLIPQPGDIVLVTYPKSGTNWTAQILSLLKTNGIPPQTGEEFLTWCPFLEFTGTDVLKTMSEPRCYKTHMDYAHTPKSPDAKYICVIRNPKDCLISLFHFMQASHFGFKGGKFEVIFDLFVKGEAIYNDYFDHVLSWYERRYDDNVLFLYYEQMKVDIEKSIKDIGNFLGGQFKKAIEDPKILADVIEFSSLDYMKKTTNDLLRSALCKAGIKDIGKTQSQTSNEEGTHDHDDGPVMVRKGIVGDWRNVLTAEQNDILDDLIERRFKGTEMYNYWKANECI